MMAVLDPLKVVITNLSEDQVSMVIYMHCVMMKHYSKGTCLSLICAKTFMRKRPTK